MRPVRPRLALAAALVMAGAAGPALAAGAVHLKTSWLRQHKNRVTVADDCRIDRSHQHPNPIGEKSEDGDLHAACRCPTVALPMVAEIVNAAKFPDAVALAKAAAKDHQTVRLGGVWRLWLEHPPPAGEVQVQGATVPVATGTNPDHAFELHPLVRIGGEALTASFVPIPGFKAYPAKTAFDHYEKRKLDLSRNGSFTVIEGKKAAYNYTSFVFTVAGKPRKKADGWFVMATVDGITAAPRRMVIAADTPPAALIATAGKGMRFEATGIPRINLERVDFELKHHPQGVTGVTGAYEMIIVALAKKP